MAANTSWRERSHSRRQIHVAAIYYHLHASIARKIFKRESEEMLEMICVYLFIVSISRRLQQLQTI